VAKTAQEAEQDSLVDKSQRIVTERTIWRTARTMVDSHGGLVAAVRARQRADALLKEGNLEGSRMWKRVHAAIEEWQRTKLNEGERVN
jgi:hypothetical protein